MINKYTSVVVIIITVVAASISEKKKPVPFQPCHWTSFTSCPMLYANMTQRTLVYKTSTDYHNFMKSARLWEIRTKCTASIKKLTFRQCGKIDTSERKLYGLLCFSQ